MNLTALFAGETTANDTQAGSGSLLTMLLPLALLALVFYFFIYRPQKKQEKETANMRSSIELGDVIVTTGGIIGMVVKVKDDMILIETSGDRTKIQIQKWAVHSVIEKANEPEVKEVKSVKSDSGIKMKSKEDKSEKKEKKSFFGKKKDKEEK
ncbi:MAG: preprotein translocase subunit YajC [Clostridia bacterium]|nr:preprotein translocase subunit YajC [Clostridia bacterium]